MESAHERAQREATAFLTAHPDLFDTRDDKRKDLRFENGETAKWQPSTWLRRNDTSGHPIPIGDYESFESFEHALGSDVLYTWRQKSLRQVALTAFIARLMERMRPEDAGILHRRFFEGMSFDALAVELGITRQGAMKKVSTALANLRRELALLQPAVMATPQGRGRPKRDEWVELRLAEVTLEGWQTAAQDALAFAVDLQELMEDPVHYDPPATAGIG